MTDTDDAKGLTVLSLFADDDNAAKMDPAVFESTQSFAELWDKVGAVHSGITKNGVAQTALNGVKDVLDVPLTTYFAEGWNTCRAIWAYGDPRQHPNEETNMVPIGDHTLTHACTIRVEIEVLGKKVKEIDFELEVALIIRAAVLTIRSGRIYEIRLASCAGSGKITCKGAILMDRETHEVLLPGTLHFKDGIPIRADVG